MHVLRPGLGEPYGTDDAGHVQQQVEPLPAGYKLPVHGVPGHGIRHVQPFRQQALRRPVTRARRPAQTVQFDIGGDDPRTPVQKHVCQPLDHTGRLRPPTIHGAIDPDHCQAVSRALKRDYE